MSAPLATKFACSECSAHFTLTAHEIHSKSRAHCPGCGSLSIERRRDRMAKIANSVRELAGRTTTFSTVTAGQTHTGQRHTLGNLTPRHGRFGNDQAVARRTRMMSEPSDYRRAALKGTHQRMLARREKAARVAKTKELLDPDVDYSQPRRKPGPTPRPKEPRIKVKDLTTGRARHATYSKLRDGPL